MRGCFILAVSLLLLCITATVECASLVSDAIDAFVEANAGKRCNFFIVCSVGCPGCCAKDVLEAALNLYVVSNATHFSAPFLDNVLTESGSACNALFVGHDIDYDLARLEESFTKAKDMAVYVFAGSNSVGSVSKMTKGKLIFPTHFLVEKREGLVTEHLSCPERVIRTDVNVWLSQKGFLLRPAVCPPIFSGRHVSVSVARSGYPPFLLYDADGDVTGGGDVDVLNAVAHSLHFRFEFKYEDLYGAPLPNGQWAGLVGSVHNGTTSFGIGHILMEAFYHQAVDNLHYMYPLNLVLFSAKPQPVLPLLNIVEPFSAEVWLVTVIVLAGVAFVVFAQMKASGKKYRFQYLISNPIMETVGTLLNQSDIKYVNEDFQAKSILLWFWLIGDFFVKCFYTSLLFTCLIKVEYNPPINTIADILAQNKRLWLFTGVPMDQFLAGSEIPSYKAIYKQVMDNNQFVTTVQGMLPIDFEKKLLRDGDCYLLTEQMGLASFPLEEQRWGFEPIRMADTVTFPFYGGYVGRKHALENDALDLTLSFLLSGGLVDYLVGRHIEPRYSDPPKEKDPPPQPFTPLHILGELAVLALGMVGGAVILACEISHHKTMKARKRKSRPYKFYLA